MFDRGLLVTFIPEILMVIGYLMCLFVPKTQTDSAKEDLNIKMIQVSTSEHQHTSTFLFSGYEFQTIAEVIFKNEQPLPSIAQKRERNPFESPFGCSDGLAFDKFSRPPPSFLS